MSPEDFKLNIQSIWKHNNSIIIMLNNNQDSCAAFRVSCTSCGLTSGGGSPPAPAGHSGSIFFLPSQLQKQAGDGSSMVQLLALKSCWTVSGTSGVFQSSSPIVHGASLRPGGRPSVIKCVNDRTPTVEDTNKINGLATVYKLGII